MSFAASVLLASTSPNDLTALGCSYWMHDGEVCEVESWGGNWDAGTVARLAIQHRIRGRVAHCESKCVTTIDAAPGNFCLEPNARIFVHLERDYAGRWRKDPWWHDWFELEHPLRVIATHVPKLRQGLLDFVESRGGWKQPTWNDEGEATDLIDVPYAVAVRFWHPCPPLQAIE